MSRIVNASCIFNGVFFVGISTQMQRARTAGTVMRVIELDSDGATFAAVAFYEATKQAGSSVSCSCQIARRH